MPPGPNRNGDVFIHRVDSAARFARAIHRRTGAPLPPTFIETSWVASPAVPNTLASSVTNYAAGNGMYGNIALDRAGGPSLSQIMATMATLGLAPTPEPDPWTRIPLQPLPQSSEGACTSTATAALAREYQMDARQEFAAEYMADFVAHEHDDYMDRRSAAAMSQIQAQREAQFGEARRQEGPGITFRATVAQGLRGRTNSIVFYDDQAYFSGFDPAIEQAPDAPIIDFILAARAKPPVYERRSVWQRLLEDT